MTAGPPTEPPILTAEQVAEMFARLTYPNTPHWVNARRVCDSHEALRARLRDAEARIAEVEPLAQAADAYCWSPTPENTTQLMNARARYQALVGRRRLAERHADPQEPA